MDKDEIFESIINSINIFIEKEKFLLVHNLNERTITHKFANYIEKIFPNYDVDCEYNRFWNSNNNKEYISKHLDFHIYGEDLENTETEKINVYPDIIIHKRWNKDNLIIIELKKKEYAETNMKNRKMTYWEFDKVKIKKYMEQETLSYNYWIYIEFNGVNYIWFFYYKELNDIKEMILSDIA